MAVPLMMTPSEVRLITTSSPLKVVADMPSTKSVLMTFPLTTWYNKMEAKSGFASKSSAVISKAVNKVVNAASVGANTVKGPAPLKSSSNSAAITAVSKTVWFGLSMMISATVAGVAGSVTVTVATIPLAAWFPMLQS